MRVEFELVYNLFVHAKGHEMVGDDERFSDVTKQRDLTIYPNEGGSRDEGPIIEHPTLFNEFAALDASPNAFLNFANCYGLLYNWHLGESLDRWFDLHEDFNEALTEGPILSEPDQSFWLDPGGAKALDFCHDIPALERLNVIIQAYTLVVFGTRGGPPAPKLVIRARSLAAAMAIQLGDHLFARERGEIRIVNCLWCGKAHQVGSGTDSRRSRKFCNDTCKNRFNYRRKKQEQGSGA